METAWTIDPAHEPAAGDRQGGRRVPIMTESNKGPVMRTISRVFLTTIAVLA